MGGRVKHYPHHIGDFDKATRHLTRIERSVYRDLIDLYYATEQRLTLDVQALCRRIIARSNEEATAVQQVLNEFFTETPTGWYHDRCEAEIEAYRANTSQKAIAGKASAEAKRLRKLQALNAGSTAVEQPLKTVVAAVNGTPTNHQPSTNQPSSVTNVTGDKSPEQMTKDELWSAGKSLLSASMPAKQCGSFVGKLVQDYGDAIVIDAVRSAVVARPADPAEYLKATCQHAAGLRQRKQPVSFAQQDELARRKRWEEMTGRKWPESEEIPAFIDIETKTVQELPQ